MADSKLPKQFLLGQLLTSKSVGRPLLRFKDNLNRCSIRFSSWENKASGRRRQHLSCFSSIERFERSWLEYRDQLYANIKASWQHAAPHNDSLTYHCGFLYAINLVLLSTRGTTIYVPTAKYLQVSGDTCVSIEVEHTLFYWSLRDVERER